MFPKIKTGIYGGSFNPPHLSHLQLADEVLKNFNLDEIWFMPVANHPFSKNLLSSFHRIKMLEFLIEDTKKVFVSDYEIKLDKNKPSYTYDTLKSLEKLYLNREFYLIIGSDILPEFSKWFKYENILNEFNIIVVPRQNSDLINIYKKIEILDIEPIKNISSSLIRSKIDRNENIEGLVGKKINEYIIKNNLYKANFL